MVTGLTGRAGLGVGAGPHAVPPQDENGKYKQTHALDTTGSGARFQSPICFAVAVADSSHASNIAVRALRGAEETFNAEPCYDPCPGPFSHCVPVVDIYMPPSDRSCLQSQKAHRP